MKAIAIINLKGGVGKTVTAINVAAILAQDYGKRVLLVDADSQHNTTDFFGVGDADNNLSVFLRAEGESIYTCYIQKTDIEGLDVLPGDDGLMDLDISHIRDGRVRGDVLLGLIECIVEDDEYDYVIYDCPPAFNAASTAALAASTDAVIPIKLDAFSLSGLSNMIHQISAMHRINPRLRVAGCLITMWSKADAEAEKKLRSVNAKVLPTFQAVIRRSDKVNAMTFSGEPLTIYSPRSAAGVDYRRFVEEYLKTGEYPLMYAESSGRVFPNPTPFNAKPLITVYGEGGGTIILSGETIEISDIKTSITIDCETRNAYSGAANRNGDITVSAFPELPTGSVAYSFSGGVTSIEIIPRWWTV